MTSRSSLLVDIGSTYVKVAVLRSDENIDAETKFQFPPFLSLAGPYRTVDPAVVLDVVEGAIASVLPEADNPDRILLSGQMHGWTLTDRHNEPQLPLATFGDNRALRPDNGTSRLDELRNALPSQTWLATGNELRSGLPVAGIYATDLSAFDGPLRVHSLLSWVAASLTGKPAFVQHTTDAAASGMFDLHAGSWCEQATTLVGGNARLELPRVSSTPEVVGKHRTSGATVFTPIGDQQAALLGAGLRHGVTAFNISTGGQVARLAETHAEDRCQTRPYFDGLLLHTVTHLPAGRALTHGVELLSRLQGDDAWAWAMQAAAEPVNHSLPQAHPTFHDQNGGGWSGITDAHTAEDLLRALVSAIAAPYVDSAPNVGFSPTDQLLFCGGVAQRFTPLPTAIQSALDRPATVAPDGDMALRGLAVVANRL
ncbi:sugar kinase [Mycobacterium ahvazicum]|uniref:Sugar kinase n=1 Tax=Mycobacterium ahvazicum TaxID=1964395 RepID=A0A2K4Y9W6_9MYCO|nr:FGGY family carbohydrate kinase [Mycobacterium ahvazicum]SOX53586.1 sugar kinase [Mycobacterium ahvazicum]